MRRPTMIRLRRVVPWPALLVLFVLALPQSPGAAEEKASGVKGDAKKPAKLDVNAVPENARRVEFTTDEGTWMSVDVSPDGRTILFDLLGDIYTLPIAGGKATRITSGLAFDAQPRYS